jgi:hydroxymethylpyrimidine pyrophosphatase-like HAD family hydrolase
MDTYDYPKIIAVDFDGCLVINEWPNIGLPIPKNIDKLKEEQANGAKIILWSSRVGQSLTDAIRFCNELNIYFDAVNENLPEIIELYGGDPRKIFASEYWDDRAVLKCEHDTNLPTWIGDMVHALKSEIDKLEKETNNEGEKK